MSSSYDIGLFIVRSQVGQREIVLNKVILSEILGKSLDGERIYELKDLAYMSGIRLC